MPAFSFLARGTARLPTITTTRSWWVLLSAGLIFSLCLRNAWSTLDRYFLSDDFAYVARFHALAWREWPALFLNDWSGGIWGSTLPELRPFAALTFLWDAQWWGLNPLGYHLTNLLLEAGCAGLVAATSWQVLRLPGWASVLAAAIFACHPAHAEPVAWITGRVDLLGTLAYLVGFYAAARSVTAAQPRGWIAGAIGAYFVGVFSKEFCLTMPVMFGLWWWIYRPAPTMPPARTGWGLLAGFLAVVAVYALCRHHAFSGGRATSHGLAVFSHDYAERQMDYLRWFFTPLYNLGRDYRPELAAIAPTFVLGVGLLALTGWWLARRWWPEAAAGWRAALFFGFIWYLVATLPMAAASYFSPRHLYLATAGGSIAFAALLVHVGRPRLLLIAVAAWSLVFSLQSFDHAVAAWRHSAKVSERITTALHTELAANQADAIVLDVPPYYEGVGLWAWATPFALKPPFLPESPVAIVEAPLVYFNPEGWLRPALLAELHGAPGARVISLNARGFVEIRRVTGDQWAKTRTLLPTERGPSGVAGYESAWQQFLSALRTP